MTKNLERKKKGQTQGRTNRRMPICNPTIQLVIVNLFTKYEVSILNGCGDIFDEKVLRNYRRMDGRTDGKTDRTTDRCKPVYPPLFQSKGIINIQRKVNSQQNLAVFLAAINLENIIIYILHGKGQIKTWTELSLLGQVPTFNVWQIILSQE